MADGSQKIITKKGLKKLKDELKSRSDVLRKEIADKLDEAKAQGDLSENSAYTSALEEYHMNEAKISEIKDQIATFRIAPDRSGDATIDIGDTVDLRDVKNNEKVTYTIVGQGEGDPMEGLVSANSVVGAALLGKKEKDNVKIALPAGETEYKITKVS